MRCVRNPHKTLRSEDKSKTRQIGRPDTRPAGNPVKIKIRRAGGNLGAPVTAEREKNEWRTDG